jgi:hypothetical protein
MIAADRSSHGIEGNHRPMLGFRMRVRFPDQYSVLLLFSLAAVGWVAWWNAFPIMMWDTRGYVLSAFTGEVFGIRPSLYPDLIRLISARISLWPVLLFQVAVSAFVLVTFLDVVFGLQRCAAACTITAVCAFTTLPWWAATLVTDVFSGIIAIAAYLLIFQRARLTQWRTTALTAILFGACTFHLSYPVVLLLCLPTAILLLRPAAMSIPQQARKASLVVIAAAAGMTVFPAINLGAGNGFAPSTSTDLFIVARLAGDGIISRLLNEHCVSRSYVLCPWQTELTRIMAEVPSTPEATSKHSVQHMRTFRILHGENSPLRASGTWRSNPGLRRIIWDAMAYYPGENVRALIAGTTRQFFLVGMPPMLQEAADLEAPGRFLMRFLPSEHAEYMRGRQATGRLYVGQFERITVPITYGGILFAASCFICMMLAKRRMTRLGSNCFNILQSASFFFIYNLMNAATMYALSTDVARYQSRCAWLLPMSAIVAMTLFAGRTRGAIHAA